MPSWTLSRPTTQSSTQLLLDASGSAASFHKLTATEHESKQKHLDWVNCGRFFTVFDLFLVR